MSVLSLAMVVCAGLRSDRPQPIVVEVSAMSKCAFSAQLFTAPIPTVKALDGRAEPRVDYAASVDGAGNTSRYGNGDLSGNGSQLCVADATRTKDACGYAIFKRCLDCSLKGLEVLEVAARSAVGRKMLANVADPSTPHALFSPPIEKEAETFARLRGAGLSQLPSYAGYAMVIRSQGVAEVQLP